MGARGYSPCLQRIWGILYIRTLKIGIPETRFPTSEDTMGEVSTNETWCNIFWYPRLSELMLIPCIWACTRYIHSIKFKLLAYLLRSIEILCIWYRSARIGWSSHAVVSWAIRWISWAGLGAHLTRSCGRAKRCSVWIQVAGLSCDSLTILTRLIQHPWAWNWSISHHCL